MALITNLVSFWELGEASGNRVDSVATANDLGVSGTVTQTSPLISVGNAVALSSSGFLTKADNASLSITGNLTISGWFKATNYAGAMRPAWSKWNSGANQRSYLLYYEDGSDAFVFALSAAGSSGSVFHYFLSAPSTSTTYFIVCTYDGVNVNSYVNGGAPASDAYSGGIFDGTANFEIGGQSTQGFYWPGTIDQVGLWNRAITPTEITALYNGGAGMSYAAMVAYTGEAFIAKRNRIGMSAAVKRGAFGP